MPMHAALQDPRRTHHIEVLRQLFKRELPRSSTAEQGGVGPAQRHHLAPIPYVNLQSVPPRLLPVGLCASP